MIQNDWWQNGKSASRSNTKMCSLQCNLRCIRCSWYFRVVVIHMKWSNDQNNQVKFESNIFGFFFVCLVVILKMSHDEVFFFVDQFDDSDSVFLQLSKLHHVDSYQIATYTPHTKTRDRLFFIDKQWNALTKQNAHIKKNRLSSGDYINFCIFQLMNFDVFFMSEKKVCAFYERSLSKYSFVWTNSNCARSASRWKIVAKGTLYMRIEI